MGGGDSTPARSIGSGTSTTGSSFFAKLGFSGDGDQEPAYSGHPGATGDFGRPGTGSSGSQDGNSGYYVSPYRNAQPGVTTSSSGMAGFGNSDANTSGPIENRSLAAKAAYYSAQSLASVASIASSVVAASGGVSKPADFGYATNRGPNAYNSNTYMPQSGSAVNGFSGTSASGNAWGNANSMSYNVPQEPGAGLPGSIVPEIPKHASGLGRAGGAASDGEYERAMIEGLCEPAGLKVVPPEDKLETFLVAAQTLSPDLVGPCLVDLLNSDSWQTRSKALIVIANLAKAKGCFAHNMWWVGHAEELKAMASDPKTSVRTHATKCMRALKIANSVESSEDVNPSGVDAVASPAATSTFSLLDDSDYPNPSSYPNQQQQQQFQQQQQYQQQQQQQYQQAPVNNDMGDMFAGMSVAGASAPNVGAASLLDSFSSTPTPTSVQVPPPAPTGFDFLGAAPIAPASNYQAPPSIPANNLSAFDFLDGASNAVIAPLPPTSVPPPVLPAAPASGSGSSFDDLFGSMTVNTASSQAPNQPMYQQPRQQQYQQPQYAPQAQSYASDFAGLDASPLGQAMYSAYGNQPRPMAGMAHNPSSSFTGGAPASLNLSQPYPQMSAVPRSMPHQQAVYQQQQMQAPPVRNLFSLLIY